MSASPDLVFGASGYIGTNLVEFLLADGRPVRATARNIEVLEGRGWQGVELDNHTFQLVIADLKPHQLNGLELNHPTVLG